MRTRLLHTLIAVFGLSVVMAIFWTTPTRASLNKRRLACQSNLRLIGLALQQYSQDYDEKLPSADWGTVLMPYAKSEHLFSCAETTKAENTNDYFFNSRFLGVSSQKISLPNTLILMGDGQDDAPFGILSQLPAAWAKDEDSPAWRHIGSANYLFVDGHVKVLNAKRVSRDFRMVSP